MFRAYDKKTSIKLQYKFYHWWIVDIQTGTNIDLTGEQYQRSHMLELHRIGEKNSMLGLSYEERVNIYLRECLNSCEYFSIQKIYSRHIYLRKVWYQLVTYLIPYYFIVLHCSPLTCIIKY